VGVPSIVGEKGPELFVPRNAGTIIPNHALGGGTNNTAVTYNIQAVDAASFQQLVARDPKFLHAVVEKGRRSIPQGAQR
jgi:phage-related minor tail protein